MLCGAIGNVLKTSAYVDYLQHPMWIVVFRHFSKLRVALTLVETSIVRVRHAWWPLTVAEASSCPTELYIHRLLLLDPIEKKRERLIPLVAFAVRYPLLSSFQMDPESFLALVHPSSQVSHLQRSQLVTVGITVRRQVCRLGH